MRPNHDLRYPQRVLSVADLVRSANTSKPPTDSYADPHQQSLQSSPPWTPPSKRDDLLRSVPPLHTEHEKRHSLHHPVQVADLPKQHFDDSVSPKGEPESDFETDIKRYAKLLTPFIYKLYCLVSDEATSDLCGWANGGNAFVVNDPVTFSAKVLPRYFKHNQFSSFVRQLNKYSFHKLAPGACIFGHTHFVKDRPDLLLHIGPPRPQERNGDKNRHNSIGAGGASLSSLQKQTNMSKQEMETVTLPRNVLPSRTATNAKRIGQGYSIPPQKYHLQTDAGEVSIPPIQPLTVPPGTVPAKPIYSVSGRDLVTPPHVNPTHPDKVDQIVEDAVGNALQKYTQDFNRELGIAKNERDELLHRLCAVERRNNDLELEVHNCHRRIDALERHRTALEQKRPHGDHLGYSGGNGKRLCTGSDEGRTY